jgi:ubiquinone/menaquinone biosynthesis C-methylase UbiE
VDEHAILSGYDIWAPSYDDRDPSTWLDEPFLLAQLKPFPGCRILDVGCGTGRYLRRLASGIYHIVAADVSQGMLARARRETDGGSHISWVQASATSLPFLPQSFDRIMSGLVLDHIPNVEELFSQISLVLSANGRAIIAGVHPEMQRLTGPEIQVATNMGRAKLTGHIHEVSDLVAAAHRAQLEVDAIDEPPVTQGMVDQRPAWKLKLGCPALVLLGLQHARQRPA